MPQTMKNPAQHLSFEQAVLRAGELLKREGRTILGIVGPPGSGKSTVAERLQRMFPVESQVVPMDGFHLANVELQRLGRSGRKGAPDTFDVGGYVALLQRLHNESAAELVYAPEFRRTLEEPVAGAIAIHPAARLLIAEGNYLALNQGGWEAVAPKLDEIWYVQVDVELRIKRLVARHVEFGRSERDARDWVMSTDEPNARLIEETRSCADFIVDIC